MKKRLVKFLTVCLSISTFVLSHVSLSWASFESGTAPDKYIFLTTLSACGIYAHNAVGQWFAAYKGYLRSTNNTAMLNQLDSYNSLSWGDTATNIDALYDSIKSWLSLSDAYGTDARFYTLPSQASPVPSKIGDVGISPTAFSDVNTVSEPGYSYLFSDAYNYTSSSSGRTMNVKRNIYVPSDKDVFAICTSFSGYEGTVGIEFFYVDPSSSTGCTKLDVRSIAASYWVDTGAVNGKDTSLSASWSKKSIDINSLMNMPIKVFSNTGDAQTYAKTGVVNHLFSKDECSLWWHAEHGVNIDLQKAEKINISPNMQLPKDNATAMDAYNATRGAFNLATASEKLNACGLDIDYQDTYKVEHYKQNPDGEGWTKTDEESLTGAAGDIAAYTAKSYDGFTLDTSLTTPDSFLLPGDGSLTIKLYYKRKDINYTVEHYQQGLDGNGWIKADTENLSGMFGTKATYTAKSYPGLKYDSSLTTPKEKDLELTSEKDLVIKLYYKRDTVNYTVEHYQQNTDGEGWTKKDTDSFTGFHGATASHTPKSYTGFSLDSSLTVPQNLSLVSGSKMTVKLYYKRNSINYTVNHYQQALNGKDWTKTDTESLTGLYGSDVKYTPKDYLGYVYDSTLTKLASKTLKEALTVDLYYTRQKITYTVEHYKGRENQDMTISWTLAEKEKLSGIYGKKATYAYKNYTDYPYDARLTKADKLDLFNDDEVVIKLYYVKPFGVGVLEDMVNSVADVLVSAAWAGLGFITTGIVSLYCIKLYKNTALQAVTGGKLSEKANMVQDFNKKTRSRKTTSSSSKTSK